MASNQMHPIVFSDRAPPPQPDWQGAETKGEQEEWSSMVGQKKNKRQTEKQSLSYQYETGSGYG